MKSAVRRITIALLLVLVALGTWWIVQPSGDQAEPIPVKSPQQVLYEECVAARDHEIHEKTFATIDNPDVQREVLATQKEIAKRECRKQFPGP